MIIAISGSSGSGKTFLSNRIVEYAQIKHDIKVGVLSIDNYYKNSNFEKFPNYDHPDAFNIELLLKDIKNFKSNGVLANRRYCFIKKTSQSLGEGVIDVLVIEGLYSFYFEEIKRHAMLKVFIDLSLEKSINRRLSRDESERGIDRVTNQIMIDEFVIDMYKKYVTSQIGCADIVIEDSKLSHLESILDEILSTFNQ
jgi:uridine kinase